MRLVAPKRAALVARPLVVGLGNPVAIAGNRHNSASRLWTSSPAGTAAPGVPIDGQLAETRIDGHQVALLKPETS